MVTGVLIDPAAQEVRPVHVEPGDLQSYYELIGCDIVAPVYLGDDGAVVYVDEEGLAKGPQHFFLIEGCSQPLAGRGVMVGTDKNGDTIDSPRSADWVRENVDFGAPLQAGNILMFIGNKNVREIR